MNRRVTFKWVLASLLLSTTPGVVAQSEPPAKTNAPAAAVRNPAPLPPFPPATRLPVHQLTNRIIQRPGLTSSLPIVPALARPAVSVALPAPTHALVHPFPLVWDAEAKEYAAKPGETNAHFTFNLTNASAVEVSIDQVRTSCGCTVAKLPGLPWKLPPGTNGQIGVVMDLRGKRGVLSKMVYVHTSAGVKNLSVKTSIPDALLGMGDRSKNLQIAAADRQAVFRNDCAECHATPAINKKGKELYAVACGICHDAEHRATMVPDLRNLNHSTDRNYWKVWTTQGKAATLMPAFAQSQGGPLNEEQIDSLADYLTEHIPSCPAAAPVAPASPAAGTSGSVAQ